MIAVIVLTWSDPMERGELSFGPFTLSLDRRELRLGASPVALGPRSLDLLELLAGRAGDVVGKHEIAARLWPQETTERSRLRARVAALRRALREGEGGGRYIVNVLGRGYVFVAPVRRAAATCPPDAPGLPAGADALLGRAHALATLEALVRRQRLVSVVGAPGSGKSALALAAARRCAPAFAGGVAYLDLAPLADGALLAGALAGALGLAGAASVPALCAHLAHRRILLVMDNCGHLAEPAALLAEALLEAGGQVHLLVTSREALCVQTEWVHRLAPLATPHPALDLFLQQLADNGVPALDAATLARAARLCRQLDGNPLLIRLAAARVGAVGLGALAGGVDALFAPAAADGATDAQRHASPDALLDWSCRLLGERERTVLRRLSVFRHVFTLERAAEACACHRIGAPSVIDSVLALCACSLVEVEESSAAARYRLSNATRRYARRRLAQDAGQDRGQRQAQAPVTSRVVRMPA